MKLSKVLDVLFSREGLCPDEIIMEYKEIRDNCSNFNELCKRARDALYPYISLQEDELTYYSLV